MEQQLLLKPIDYTPLFIDGSFQDNLDDYTQLLFKTTGVFCPCNNNIYNNKANFRHQHIKTQKHKKWLKSLQEDSPMILKEIQDLKEENKDLKIRNGHLSTNQIKLERQNNELKSKIENRQDNKDEINELEEYFKEQMSEKRIKFKTKRQKFKTKKQELKNRINILEDILEEKESIIEEKEKIIEENKDKYEIKIDKLINNLDNYENVIVRKNDLFDENEQDNESAIEYEDESEQENEDESEQENEEQDEDENETIESNISECPEPEQYKDEFHYITNEQLIEYNKLKELKKIFANTEDKFEKLIKLLFDWDLNDDE